MRSPRERSRARERRRSWYAACAAAAAAGTLLTTFSCATQESHDFSDNACVGDGCQATSPATSSSGSSSSSSGCPDPDAGPSFATDIYAAMLDVGGTAQCTQGSICHGNVDAGGAGGLVLPPMDPADSYTALMAMTLKTLPPNPKQYIVPGDPGTSGMPCNMAVSSGGTNPFGACGPPLMPSVGGTGMDLSVDQINTIATWISCGAKDN
jgi:hypothetical protein